MSSPPPPPPPPLHHLLNISTNNVPNLSCFHLSSLRSHDSPLLFHNVIQTTLNTVGLKCLTCGHAPNRLYACIACPEFFCKLHAQVHAHAFSDASHSIAMDVERVELYCCLCKDQVYDKEFDAAVVLAKAGSLTGKSQSQSLDPNKKTSKRRRVEYKPWMPDQMEKDLILENSTPLNGHVADQKENSKGHVADKNLEDSLKGHVAAEIEEGVILESSTGLRGHVAGEIEKGVILEKLKGHVAEIGGLRGLNNLGNTCFMNSVLQALIHTPPLRNYFLSDKHNRYLCRRNNSMDNVVVVSTEGDQDAKMKIVKFCLACELDGMFSVAFSGDQAPFTPAKFLYSWWQHASNLASYEQQDAHEFFISILDGVHEKLQMNQGKPQSQVTSDCCIAHKVFSGILRSDVMCTACGFTSTTYDPCVDISLDLEPTKGSSSKTSKKSKQKFGNIDLSQKSTRMATLLGCLDRFTRPERLGSDQKFFCQQCQVRQESLKQMSIRKLPMVSCFHIKRFEHSSFRKMTRKVDSYLQFPFSLDLAPYLSSSILKSRFGNRMFYFEGSESDASNEFSSEFELFAVITHTGKLDSGHYVTYLRLSNQWYKCDDAWITQVSDNVVRASQGYMMFYVQKMLYYKASESSKPA